MIPITSEEFDLLARYIQAHSGIHLREEKKTLLVTRLNGLVSDMKLNSFSEYYSKLKKDSTGLELSRLLDKITTNHTYFMREAEHFIFLKNEVLPQLRSKLRSKDLRIWCAASSSGEEPYTLAFILDEFFGNEGFFWDKRLLATDLSISILEKAVNGVYGAEEVKSMSKLWVLNYFDKNRDGTYTVKEKIKKEVIFRRFNLLEPNYPFKKKFHVIFCRNVMIYFDNPTKDKVVQKMYNLLEPGGYLFIGHSESISRERHPFKYIRPAVYRKI